MKILLTGSTGYVGHRLLKCLLDKGYFVRCIVRNPQFTPIKNHDNLEIVQGDALDKESISRALEGIDAAYYLIHSMGGGSDFDDIDRLAAQNFIEAANHSQLKIIIYLGGLAKVDASLSKHLSSRLEVGSILRSSNVPVIEFRASIIIGSGSLSFEMVRSLSEHLPIMITPKWVSTESQPIGIMDVLNYLSHALLLNISKSVIYEIGGPDIVSYKGLIKEYCKQRKLKRWIISVPVMTPYLSSLWLGLVTPLYARIGKKLVDSIKVPTIVTNPSALKDFPIKPLGVPDMIALALRNEDKEFAESFWTDAISSTVNLRRWGGVRLGSRLIEYNTITVPRSPEATFKPIQRIGGKTGWYFANFLWSIRGFLDLCVGGVGMKRGRKHPEQIKSGDIIDCWRVEEFIPNKKLRLIAEMKLPGRAWLEFIVKETSEGTQVEQTATFDPLGLFGLCYWYAIYPLHKIIFRGMLKNISKTALTL